MEAVVVLMQAVQKAEGQGVQRCEGQTEGRMCRWLKGRQQSTQGFADGGQLPDSSLDRSERCSQIRGCCKHLATINPLPAPGLGLNTS